MKQLVKIGSKPAVISQAEYERVTELYAMGYNKQEVVKAMGYNANWYYNKIMTDPYLRRAETNGIEIAKQNLNQNIVASLNKSISGFNASTKKTVYEFVLNYDEHGQVLMENGKPVYSKIKKGEIVEEKYIPPNGAIINQVAKQVIGSVASSDNGIAMIEEKLSTFSDEDIETLAKMASSKLSKD